MPRISGPLLLSLTTAALLLAASAAASSQSQLPAPRSRILQAVDDARVTTLSGNTHPLARPEFDQGALADSTPLSRIVLILKRSPEQESALQQLIDNQQDKTSSTYHQWLTPETFGAAFGPSDRDLSTVTTWLANHNFTGIQGRQHFANASDPSVPAALAPVVAGIASLNNFPRRAASHRLGNFRHDPVTNRTTRLQDQTQSAAEPSFTINDGETSYGVTPYDFAAIYNILPLWNASTPIDGTGQTIAIVGQTDINPADFVNFRKLFNLPLGNTATPTGTQYLNIIYNGPNPGIGPDEGEADIDTQWSAAVAKGATIDYVVSEGTEVTQGTDLSAIYIVNNNLAPVMSYSYGQCELFLGTSGNAFYNNLWQQAAAQGITVLLASGDSGSAGCDNSNANYATNGLGVNGLASTPYNVSVGGTDFYMLNGGTAYWSSANNPTTQASAKGYIPEAPWNGTCTNAAFSTLQVFSGQTPEQICNSSTAISNGILTVTGAGGGASACIQSNGSSPSSCKGGYPKPSWQTGTGVPADGVRDIPDVSLFASSGFFGAFYVVCQQSSNTDGPPCSLTAPPYASAGYGGTSVPAPAFAGIISLVNQKTGSRQGNANYVLYSLANQQRKSGATCDASIGAPSANCLFNDITTNTITQPCLKGTPNCTTTNAAHRYGILSGWSSTTGYDLASGLGSVNAANLVNGWTSATFRSTATTLALAPVTITHGSPVSATAKVTATTGTPTGNVSINALVSNGALGNGALSAGAYATSLSGFPGGAYSVQAHYAGDGTFAPSDSNPVALTVNPEPSTTRLQLLLYSPSFATASPVSSGSSYPYGGFYLIRTDVAGVSGQGTATGNVALTDGGSPLDGGTFRLNSTGNTEDQTAALAPGVHTFAAVYSGDASFNPSQSTPVTLTITKAETISGVSSGSTSVSAGSTVTLYASVTPQGFQNGGLSSYGLRAPGGAVTFKAGNTTLGTATLTQKDYPASGSVNFILPASQLAIGSNAITVSYPGDANYGSSISSAITVNVTGSNLASSTTTLSLSAATVAPGASFTFTAKVAPNSPSPTGTVVFTSDGQVASNLIALSSGSVSLSNKNLTIAPGSHIITAIYSGDANYKASVSAPAIFTIISPTIPSATTVSVSPTSVVQGTAATVTATITPNSPTPTGTAQLLLDGSAYGQPAAVTGTNTFSLTTTTLQPGPHVLQVLYSGDSPYLPSTSASTTLNILASVGTFTLSPSTSSATVAQGRTSTAVTLTAIPLDGFHSTITFSCTGGLPSGSTCNFAPTTLRPSGPTAVTTALTIVAAATGKQSISLHPASRVPWLPATTGITIGGLLLCGIRRNRRWSTLFLLMAIATLAAVTGCGSGVVGQTSDSHDSSTAGTYAITVTATGGSTIQTATLNLTVQ